MKRIVALGLLGLLTAGGLGCQSATPTSGEPKPSGPAAGAPADKKPAEAPAAKPAEKPKAPFVYAEAMGKDERLYVFGTAAAKAHFDKTGAFPTEKFTTEVGAGPKGETVRFESDEAKAEYKKKHP